MTCRIVRISPLPHPPVPAPIPYANLTNPQTLNLYSMVADDPESFADLDGHECPPCIEEAIEIAVEHPEATEKVVQTTIKVVTTAGEAAEETVSAIGKGAFGAVIFWPSRWRATTLHRRRKMT
jgi:hypothetical protein